MSWAPGTEPVGETGPASQAVSHPLEHHQPCSHHTLPLPVSDTSSAGAQRARSWEWTRWGRGAALLPAALLMALTQKLDLAHPWLSPPCEAQSFDPRPGLSAWSVSRLKQLPPEGFLMQRGCPPSGLNSRVGQLTSKCSAVSKCLLLPLLPAGCSGGSSEPCVGSGHRTQEAQTCAFANVPGLSSPVRSQKTPSAPWACPAGWVGKGDWLSDPLKTLPEIGVGRQNFEERTTQRGPWGIYIFCVWLSGRQAEGRAESQRPSQEAAKHKTVPKPVSQQEAAQWVRV